MTMHLSSIHIYPFKSAAGTRMSSVTLDRLGPELDRRWMLIESTGAFVSQRTQPRMALIDAVVDGDTLMLHAPGMESLQLPLRMEKGSLVDVVVWGSSFHALAGPAEGSKWASQYLGIKCRLVYMPSHFNRKVEPGFAPANSQVGFADGYPLLLIGEASLEDLNSRLVEPVSMSRFRPNLVVRGCLPYAEDGWRRIQIGEVSFRIVKPCGRCSMTTVDPKSGEFNGKEPLKTLATYRRWEGEAVFGQNLVHENLGTLHVGQRIKILEAGAPLEPLLNR
jgi:uncharacterized protein